MSPSSDDQETREPVGAVLARMRHARGLTGADLASMVNMSQPKISRIERGQGQPDPRDIATIARALGAGHDEAQALAARAERSRDRMTDWRSTLTDLADRQKALTSWESAATVAQVFEPALVPGPLQTSGYAKAVVERFHGILEPAPDDPAAHERTVLTTVSARIKRQEALATRSKSFRFLLGEAVLRRPACPPMEMLAQISHLREVATRNANVSIAVIRDDTLTVLPLLHGFTLLDDQIVVVDLYNTGLTSRSRRDIEGYQRVFATLERHAEDIMAVLDEYQARYVDLLRTG